jgi:hypothetical protein
MLSDASHAGATRCARGRASPVAASLARNSGPCEPQSDQGPAGRVGISIPPPGVGAHFSRARAFLHDGCFGAISDAALEEAVVAELFEEIVVAAACAADGGGSAIRDRSIHGGAIRVARHQDLKPEALRSAPSAR